MIEAVWHDDGHQIHLELNKSEVLITSVSCPHTGACGHAEASCVVDHFVRLYGLDCNVGVAPIESDMKIAWTMIGPANSLEMCQLWIIPCADYVWHAWSESEKSSSSSNG
jgi:hypothetical protein